MSKSKKIFLLFAAIFITIILIIMYDIARKTTFPGGSKTKKENVQEIDGADSVKRNMEKNNL